MKQFYLFLLKTCYSSKKRNWLIFFVYNIHKHIYYNNQHFQQKQYKLPSEKVYILSSSEKLTLHILYTYILKLIF